MLNNRVDTVELIRIVDAVANEKSIDKELVLTSMEEAIEKAARTRYGQENNIYVSINRFFVCDSVNYSNQFYCINSVI